MKLVFMGTPDFAVPCLKSLIDAGHDICGVYTQPDKPVGRKQIMTPPPVKSLALENNINVYQPLTFKDNTVVNELKSLEPDAVVVVAYGKLLPKSVLDIPKYGCINVHASLLPKYRGAAPIQWAVLNGDKETGVATMLMGEGLDTGDILLVEKTEIGENETSGELFDRLSDLGAELIVKTVSMLPSGIKSIPQDHSLATHTSKITKALSPIDWNDDVRKIHNQVRGLAPWPVAQTVFKNKTLKLHSTLVCTDIHGNNGEVIEKNGNYFVCCPGGALKLIDVQYEGSKRMKAADFFRGHPISKGEILGVIE